MKASFTCGWALASSCLLMGCGDRAGADGGGSGTDGGTETGTGEGSTGEPPFAGVRRNTVVTFVAADDGISTRSIDPTSGGFTWAVEVGAGATLQSFPGEYDPVGWLEFPGVPEAPFLLRSFDAFGRPTLTALDVRDVDADGVLRAGRSTALVARTGTPRIALTVSSMTPLGEEDVLELYSRNVDALDPWLDVFDGDNPPGPGATALEDWTFSWDARNVVEQVTLVEPIAGDDLWLTHLVAEPIFAEPPPEAPGEARLEALVKRLVEATPVELDQAIADGATADGSGSFVNIDTTPVSLDLRLDQFRAELDASIGSLPAGLDVRCRARVVVAPGEDVPVDGMTPMLAEVLVGAAACPPGGCEVSPVPLHDRVFELEFGNPFDFGTEMLEVLCWASSDFTHPETQMEEYVSVSLHSSFPLADGGPVAPALGMSTDLRIGGEPCGVNDVLTGVGTTPTISLSPPSLGTPDSYAIRVMRLEGPAAFEHGNPDLIGIYETTTTSFTLPEGLLEPGAYYHLLVQARSGRRLGEARAYTHEQHAAVTTSGLFTP